MIIRATALVTYQDYMNDTISYDELLNRYRGLDKPSVFMETGTAFHELVEGLTTSNDLFDVKAQQLAKSIGSEFVFKELRRSKMLAVRGRDVVLTGKVDGISGDVIHDVKTKYSYIDADTIAKYSNSHQGLIYCYLFEKRQVTYHIVNLKQSKTYCKQYDKDLKETTLELPLYSLTDYCTFDVFFDDVNDKVERLMLEFASFLISNDLEQYFMEAVV